MSEPNFKIAICPSCNTGIEENLLKESKSRCIECGNTDWSEEARNIPKGRRKENCVECGKLLDIDENSVTDFRAYSTSNLSSISSRALRKYRDKEKLGWLYFCKTHGDHAKPDLVDKIIAENYLAFPIAIGSTYLARGGLHALYAVLEGRPDLMSQYFVETVKDPYTGILAIAIGVGVTLYERNRNRKDIMRLVK